MVFLEINIDGQINLISSIFDKMATIYIIHVFEFKYTGSPRNKYFFVYSNNKLIRTVEMELEGAWNN